MIANDAEQVSLIACEIPDINALTKEGADFLSLSIDSDSEAAALALISSGILLANPNSTYTAMQTALENGSKDMIDTLLNHKVDLNCRGTDEEDCAIHVLCRYYRSRDLLLRFLENGANASAANGDGETARMILQMSPDGQGNDPETVAMIDLLELAEKGQITM